MDDVVRSGLFVLAGVLIGTLFGHWLRLGGDRRDRKRAFSGCIARYTQQIRSERYLDHPDRFPEFYRTFCTDLREQAEIIGGDIRRKSRPKARELIDDIVGRPEDQQATRPAVERVLKGLVELKELKK